MNNTRLAFRLPDIRIASTTPDLRSARPTVLALAAFLLVAGPAGKSAAEVQQSNAASPAQAQGSYIDEGELNAYDAAKKEADPQKRALKLMEFQQKYPKSNLMESADYAEVRVIEDEYNAYDAASQEPDYQKRAEKLMAFLQKYPKSVLAGNVNYDYLKMLKEASLEKKYELLESLGEQWLKAHPNDRETLALIADATMNLKKYGRCAECLEEIFRMEPTPSLAREIHATYQKTENLNKQLEWADKLFKMPEFNSDYMLRYDYVKKFSESNNLPKAAEYGQLTLNSADLVEHKDAQTEEQLRKVRRACYHVIASNLMEKGNFVPAISAFKLAIKAEKYGQGYYKIAECLENQKNVEEALLYYAAAEMMGEEDAPKAKARLEILYKALHNDTLIGIDKVYKRAKEMLAEPDKST